MELNEILQVALKGGASDIHLKAGLPPMFRVDGSLVPLKDARRLPPEEIARMAVGIMSDHQKERFKQTNEVDLAYGVPGLGRFRVNVFQQRGTHRGGAPRHSVQDPDHRPADAAQGAREDRRRRARAGPRHRHHRLRQVDFPRGDDRPHQRQRDLPHHDHRGPDRVPDPGQALGGEPARGGRRHHVVRPGLEERAAPGSRRDPRRRNARLGDHRDRAHRGRDRPPGDEHPAHPGRHRDHQPRHLGLPALPAEAGAHAAGRGLARGHQPAARAEGRRPRPRGGGGDPDRHHPRARDGRGQGPHQGDPRRDRPRAPDLRDADLRPVADGPLETVRSSPTTRPCGRPPTATTSRCASAASPPPPTANGTTSRASPTRGLRLQQRRLPDQRRSPCPRCPAPLPRRRSRRSPSPRPRSARRRALRPPPRPRPSPSPPGRSRAARTTTSRSSASSSSGAGT